MWKPLLSAAEPESDSRVPLPVAVAPSGPKFAIANEKLFPDTDPDTSPASVNAEIPVNSARLFVCGAKDKGFIN